MDDADRIWNRACDLDYAPTLCGDRGLQAIVQFHSLSMNGGISQPLEVDFRLAARAASAYRMFGADHLADLVDEAQRLAATAVGDEGHFSSLDLGDSAADALEGLDARLPDDSDVEAVFRRFLAEHPDEFDAP